MTLFVGAVCVDVFQPRNFSGDYQGRQAAKPGGSFGRSFIGIGLWLLLAGLPILNLVVRSSKSVENIDGSPTIFYSAGQFGESLTRALTDYLPEYRWSFCVGSQHGDLFDCIGHHPGQPGHAAMAVAVFVCVYHCHLLCHSRSVGGGDVGFRIYLR